MATSMEAETKWLSVWRSKQNGRQDEGRNKMVGRVKAEAKWSAGWRPKQNRCQYADDHFNTMAADAPAAQEELL